MKNLMSYCTTKNIFRMLAALLLLSLVPLFVIAAYNYPAADDYSYGNYVAAAWRDSGSLSRLLVEAVQGVKTVYQTWQGSFAGVFFMILQPAVFGRIPYALAPVALLLLFSMALYLLLWTVLGRIFHAEKLECGIIWAVMTFLSVQFVLSPVEAFYWYNGAMYYTGFHAISLLMVSALLLAEKAEVMWKRTGIGLAAILLAFVVGGGNYITALTSFVTLGLITVYSLAVRRRHWLLPLAVLLVLTAALVINAVAPGNSVRQDLYQGMNPFLAILNSFWYALIFAVYFVRLPVYFALACLVPLLYRVAGRSGFSFRYPGIVTVLAYGVYASSFTPNLYSMSSLGMARVANVNFYYYLLLWLSLLFYWCGWISQQITTAEAKKKKKKGGDKGNDNTGFVAGITLVLALCFLLGCVFTASLDISAMTSVSATASLISGEAKAYHKEQLERLEMYTDSSLQRVRIPLLQNMPHVLFFDDITDNPDDWRNQAVAEYYQKESVALHG